MLQDFLAKVFHDAVNHAKRIVTGHGGPGYRLGYIGFRGDKSQKGIPLYLRVIIDKSGVLQFAAVETLYEGNRPIQWSDDSRYDWFSRRNERSQEWASRIIDIDEATRLVLGSLFSVDDKLMTPAKGEATRYVSIIAERLEKLLDEIGAIVNFYTLSQAQPMIQIGDEMRVVLSDNNRSGVMVSELGVNYIYLNPNENRYFQVVEEHLVIYDSDEGPEEQRRFWTVPCSAKDGGRIGLERLKELVAKKNALLMMTH